MPSARSVLKLAPSVPADCLEGLTQYSHCWVLYLFHANTSERRRGLVAGVVPRAAAPLLVFFSYCTSKA